MSEGRGRGKKRPKSYYVKCANKRPRLGGMALGPNMRGFLATCNKNEKGAVRELYNLLNEYGDQLYGPEKLGKLQSDQSSPPPPPAAGEHTKEEEEDSEEEEEEEDMEKAMAKELGSMREAAKAPRRFQNVQSGANNCIFIQTTLERPEELAEAVFRDLLERRVQRTRFAARLLPVQGTCRAELKNIHKLAEELFPRYFGTQDGATYSINVKVRNNNSGIGRESVIPELGSIIQELSTQNRVNHSSPDFVILVEIVSKVCCLSVVPDFTKYRKYNLMEVGRDRPEGGATGAGGGQQDRAGPAPGSSSSGKEGAGEEGRGKEGAGEEGRGEEGRGKEGCGEGDVGKEGRGKGDVGKEGRGEGDVGKGEDAAEKEERAAEKGEGVGGEEEGVREGEKETEDAGGVNGDGEAC